MLFAHAAVGRYDLISSLVHPEAQITPLMKPNEVFNADEIRGYASEATRTPYHEVTALEYEALDDDRVVVRTQVRWSLDDGMGFRIFEAAYAMVFKDDLLYRSWPAKDLAEGAKLLEEFGPLDLP